MEFLRDWPVDHCGAAVLHGGSVSFEGDVDRLFGLASVTKPLVAYAVLIAVEEGVFELNTPLGPPGATVTDLLAHTSGIGFASTKPERPPRQRRVYSSAGFEILAAAIAEETEIPFVDYLDEAVLQPLGMTRTRLAGSPGHGAESTVRDLAKFAAEVLNPTLLHGSTLSRALTPVYPRLSGLVPGYGVYKPCPWGLGFEIKGAKAPHWTGVNMPPDVAGHFGQAGTFLWVHRPTQRAMVALTERPFGDWAKPLWAETNAKVWAHLEQTLSKPSSST